MQTSDRVTVNVAKRTVTVHTDKLQDYPSADKLQDYPSADSREWHVWLSEAMDAAHELCRTTSRTVEVYNDVGSLLDEVRPDTYGGCGGCDEHGVSGWCQKCAVRS